MSPSRRRQASVGLPVLIVSKPGREGARSLESGVVVCSPDLSLVFLLPDLPVLFLHV